MKVFFLFSSVSTLAIFFLCSGIRPSVCRITIPQVQNNRIHYRHAKRRLPKAIIIGVRKGGSRALLEFLDIHPKIRICHREMHFFNNDDAYAEGLEWYRRKMPYSFADQITIEKTPAYFTSTDAAQRIHSMNSSIKLILVARNPADRAISDYEQIQQNRLSRKKQRQTFEELAFNVDGKIHEDYLAIERGIYHKHLSVWLNYFSLDQILVLSSELLITDPVSVLRKVQLFLGLQPYIRQSHFVYNPSKGFYCKADSLGRQCLSKSKGRAHPKLSPEARRKLEDFFIPHNKHFYTMVGRNFAWFQNDSISFV